jgi:hypothetical protein
MTLRMPAERVWVALVMVAARWGVGTGAAATDRADSLKS